MRITNKLGLPDAIVNAVKNDPYDRGDCDISVTQLINPAQIRKLFIEHDDKIEEDASDRIWSLDGQSLHAVLERAAEGDESLIAEWRLFHKFGDHVVGGQVDLLDIPSEIIWDYKRTSVWAVVNGIKPEWTYQLNVLAELVRQNGGEVSNLYICAFLRDWSKLEMKRRGDGYPKRQVVVIPIPLLDGELIQTYISGKLMEHFKAERPVCQDEDIWKRPDKFAVKKPNRKSAIRLYDSKIEALNHIGAADAPDGLYIEERPGENVRCEHYCAVRDFCPQYAASKVE